MRIISKISDLIIYCGKNNRIILSTLELMNCGGNIAFARRLKGSMQSFNLIIVWSDNSYIRETLFQYR